ncbi:MAG: hypothetical protein AB7P01_15040 [Bacteroidia bacterium]
MKKNLLISVALLVLNHLAIAQQNFANNTKQEAEKTTTLKSPTPTLPFMWKENGTGINDTLIVFSKEFTKALNGKKPFILVTPVSSNEGYYISEITDTGFVVKKSRSILTDEKLRFNWQAEIPYTPQR